MTARESRRETTHCAIVRPCFRPCPCALITGISPQLTPPPGGGRALSHAAGASAPAPVASAVRRSCHWWDLAQLGELGHAAGAAAPAPGALAPRRSPLWDLAQPGKLGPSPSPLGWRTQHARCVARALAHGSGLPLARGVAPRGRLEPCHAYTSGWALGCVCTLQHSLLSGQCWRLLSLRACPRARARAKAAPLLWPGLAWPVYNGH